MLTYLHTHVAAVVVLLQHCLRHAPFILMSITCRGRGEEGMCLRMLLHKRVNITFLLNAFWQDRERGRGGGGRERREGEKQKQKSSCSKRIVHITMHALLEGISTTVCHKFVQIRTTAWWPIR